MASVVGRWSTTPAINRQTIADHSFYVVLYTIHLCDHLRVHGGERIMALEWAAIHDMPETVTSDIPGPVKREVTSDERLEKVEAQIFNELGYGDPEPSDMAKRIVKAANLIDEVYYLHSERLLGNRYLDLVYSNSWSRLLKALDLIRAWELHQVIKDEMDEMERGVVGLKNDTDLTKMGYVEQELVISDDDIPF